MSKKVMILLPDGVGFRNFIYTDFLNHGEPTIWSSNNDLKIDGVEQLSLPKYSAHWLSDIYKVALVEASLHTFVDVFKDDNYISYIRPKSINNLRQLVKHRLINFFISKHKGFDKLKKLRDKFEKSLRKSSYYTKCKKQLEEEKPSFIFCTNQRAIVAAPAMLAARDLGILTGTFIFSWDNLPKGNLSVTADYYFVWSEYMRSELLKYYPFIDISQVVITGTPQFLPYFDDKTIISRENFCKTHNLNSNHHIICYSGDDVVTSPNDPDYLKDTAQSVRELNKENNKQITILFRRCPVDKSNRFDIVLEEFKDVIVSIDPLWGSLSESSDWQMITPLKEDSALLANTVYHCETVINVGSTMALDFAILNKTACYINYDIENLYNWSIEKIYKYIHFQSMENLNPVYWIDSKEKVKEVIMDAITDKDNKLHAAKKWAERIAVHPLEDANKRLWAFIEKAVV